MSKPCMVISPDGKPSKPMGILALILWYVIGIVSMFSLLIGGTTHDSVFEIAIVQ